jgi:DNA-directed RNA polymerase specialized sigma24 family protein
MRFIDDLSVGEIAEMLSVTQNVVSVRIHRALAKLRELCQN